MLNTGSYRCCLFGTLFGSACAGYISAYGPASGNRTLVVARYVMGWWPAKLCVLLNWVIEIGYGLVDCLIAGLILSAVNGGNMTVIVGIVVSALITWVVATFGIRWFHAFERSVSSLCIFELDAKQLTAHKDIYGFPLSSPSSCSSAAQDHTSILTPHPLAQAPHSPVTVSLISS